MKSANELSFYSLGRRMRYGVPPSDVLGGILLRTALPENNLSLTRMVISDGADVNHADDAGNTPLLFAVANGASEEVVQLLVDAGADVNMDGPEGAPLQVAIAHDRIEMAEVLLSHSADPHTVDISTCSEAMLALIKHSIAEEEAQEQNDAMEDGAEGSEAAGEAAQAVAAEAKTKYKAAKEAALAKAAENKAKSEAEAKEEMPLEMLESYRELAVTSILPALLQVHSDSPYEAPRRRALVCLAYMMEQAPDTILKALPQSSIFSILSVLEQLFAHAALAAALLALRLVQALLKTGGSGWCSQLQRFGALTVVQNLSEPAYIKAKGLTSESGSTSPGDVSDLAAKVLTIFQEAVASTTNDPATPKGPQLSALVEKLRLGKYEAIEALAKLLEMEGGVTAYELALSDLPSALVEFMSTPGSLQGSTVIEVFSQRGASKTASKGLRNFVRLLHNIIATGEQLPVYTRGTTRNSSGLRSLTEPTKLILRSESASLAKMEADQSEAEQNMSVSLGSVELESGGEAAEEEMLMELEDEVEAVEVEIEEERDEEFSDEEEEDGDLDDEEEEHEEEHEEEAAVRRARGLAEVLAQVQNQHGAGGNVDPITAAVAAAVRAATFDGGTARFEIPAGAMGLGGLLGGGSGGGGAPRGPPAIKVPEDPNTFLVKMEPLVELRQLEAHILRTCSIEEPAYLEYCEELVGSVIQERAVNEDMSALPEEYRTAVVIKFEKMAKTGLPIHHLRYDDGRIRKCVLAVRDYFVTSKTSSSDIKASTDVSDAAGALDDDEDPEARIRTISILCPEGFPVDMFLDSVRPAVKRALSQEDPGHAPMNRPPGAQYQWPDRGWKRESDFNNELERGLTEEGIGIIARGQTTHESEVLVNRLADVVVALVTIDRTDYASQSSAARPQEKFTRGMRVHALMTGGDWTPGTVLSCENDKYDIVFDDGTWESELVRKSIRPTGQADKQRRGHLIPGDAASFSEFLRRHLGGAGASAAASNAENALSDTAGHITRTFPAFETGAVNRAGHVDLESSESDVAITVPSEVAGASRGKRLRVAFAFETCETGGRDRQKTKKSKPSPTVPVPMQLPGDKTLLSALQSLMDSRYGSASQPAPSNGTYTLVYKILPEGAFSPIHVEEEASVGKAVKDMNNGSSRLQTSQLESCGIDQAQVRSAICLLSILQAQFGASPGTTSLWSSHKLTQKLLHQLEDPLSVASGATPEWCDALTSLSPFLFSLDARRKLLESTAFGISHSVFWVQEQVAEVKRAKLLQRRAQAERAAAEAEETGDVEAVADAADRLAEVEDETNRDRIGQLKSDIAKVKREGIVESAQKLMKIHATSSAQLEVQFEGEDGFGKGVTQNFYCAVAMELQSRLENSKTPMWVPDETGIEGFINVGLSKGAGLFPQPFMPGGVAKQEEAVCERYRFMGRLLAKACRDGFIVPLPLSDSLFSLLRGESPTPDMLPLPGSTGGVVRAYGQVVKRLESVQKNALLGPSEQAKKKAQIIDAEFTRRYLSVDYDMKLGEYLSSADVAFVDPITGLALCPGGDSKEVTVDNLGEYVELITEAWLGSPVKKQIDAMREGISEVFPFESILAKFNGSELKYMLCGDNTIAWESATLEQHLHPLAPLTRNSPSFLMLVEELLKMSNQERSDFLNFVTACPRLPPGGLGALGIEVTSQRTQSMIPTAQTCVPKLYLPEYSNGTAMRAGMMEAFKNADSGGFHENNVWHA